MHSPRWGLALRDARPYRPLSQCSKEERHGCHEVRANSDKVVEVVRGRDPERGDAFSKTVRGLRSANVNNMSTVIENGKIVSYRVNLQITFEVEDAGGAAKDKKKKKR